MDITTAVSTVMALSLATERLVEIIKGAAPFKARLQLNKEDLEPGNPNAPNDLNDPKNMQKERVRTAKLQILAVAAGIGTTFLAYKMNKGIIPAGWEEWYAIPIIGLLASAGSGFWNSILTYVTGIKDLKIGQVKDK